MRARWSHASTLRCVEYLSQRALYARHTAFAERTLAYATRAGDGESEAMARGQPRPRRQESGRLRRWRCDYHQQSLDLHTQLGNPLGQANQLGNLGIVARHQGDFAAARGYLDEAYTLFKEVGSRLGHGQ